MKYQETSRKGFGSCSSVHWAQADKTILYAGFGNGKMASYLLKDGEFYPVGVLDIGSPVGTCSSRKFALVTSIILLYPLIRR